MHMEYFAKISLNIIDVRLQYICNLRCSTKSNIYLGRYYFEIISCFDLLWHVSKDKRVVNCIYFHVLLWDTVNHCYVPQRQSSYYTFFYGSIKYPMYSLCFKGNVLGKNNSFVELFKPLLYLTEIHLY